MVNSALRITGAGPGKIQETEKGAESMKRFMCALMAVLMACGLMTACGDKEESAKSYTVDEIYDAIKEAYGEDFLPDGEMNEAEYTETYGLNMDDVEEIRGEIAMISFHPDRLLIVKAKEGKGEDVEKALTAARDNLVENGMWYPANLAKVEASKVLRHGDHVVFLMLGGVDERLEATEEEAAQFAQEQAQIGFDAFDKLFED